MSDLLAILAFSWMPLAGALALGLTAPPLGAVLSLRDEILLGLALPPVGTAAVVAAVFCGVPAENTFALYLCAVSAILIVSLLLPRRQGQRASGRWRAALLAAIFCAGQAATILMSATSTRVEAHVRHMLRGELLAIGGAELTAFLVLTLVLLGFGFIFRGMIYALALDEEGLAIKVGAGGVGTLLTFRALAAVLIAAGVIWIGPLLTLGLLAIPTMLRERRVQGLGAHFRAVMLIGVLSVLLGFLGSIALDLPPTPMVIALLFIVGGLSLAIRRLSAA
ncbi:MAG: hypothetical protein GY835_27915 [bacterium]|nr:hypothetical protein [bacterium]